MIDAEQHLMTLLIGHPASKEPKKGLLWIGSGGTIFATRKEAILAAKRTQRYAIKNEYEMWPILKGFTVYRLSPNS